MLCYAICTCTRLLVLKRRYMLRSLIFASALAPPEAAPKHKSRSGIQIGQAPTPPREPMSALTEPPRHLLSDIGLRTKGDAHQSSKIRTVEGTQDHMPEHGDLQPFACGLTGTSVEVLEPRQCDVEGAIPSWLQGDLYRNGPGTFDIETKSGSVYSVAHWFAGLTVMHKFQISGGKVMYRNRHLNREAEHFIEAVGQEPGIMLWNDPCGTLLGRAFSLFKQAEPFYGQQTLDALLKCAAALKGPSSFENYTDPKTGKQGNPNIGVTVGKFRDNQLVSRTDANALIALDPVDLTVTRKFNYTSILPEAKGMTSASHVERDEKAGLTYDFTMDLNYRLNGTYNVFCIPDDVNKEPYLLAQVQDTPCYIHSFAQTEKHLVLMVWPCVLDPLRMVLNNSVFHDMRWKPELGVKLHVIDKCKGGQGHMATYRHPAFYCFHQLNAFESGDDLIVDLAAYPDHSIMVQTHRTNMLFGLNPMDAAIPTRITLPDLPAASAAGLTTITDVSSRTLSVKPIGFELFTIHPDRKCKPYRYSWGVSCQPGDSFFNCIVRLDIKSGEHQVWAEEGTYPGEPIFVPRPGGTEEDDGVLLSVVLAGAQKRSFLLILDARDLTEIARAWTQDPVALGFHGHFGRLDEFLHTSDT